MHDTLVPAQQHAIEVAKDVEHGRSMAIFAHCSVLFGLPVFAAPLVLRDSSFALHHAKAAAVNYLLFFSIVLLSVFVWEWIAVLTILCYLPALIGVIQASNGRLAGTFGFGVTGEKVFHRIKGKNEPR